MSKRTLMLGIMLVLALAVCAKAYAAGATAEETTAWQGFWNSLGGFTYNALPWNWGNWWGK